MRALIDSPSTHLLVAAQGTEIVGYSLVLRRKGIRSARLYSLAVFPDQTGRGLGRLLLDAAECAAVKAGAVRLTLEVREDNPAAARLYERAGYRFVRARPNYYADGAGALRYERMLSPAGIARAA